MFSCLDYSVRLWVTDLVPVSVSPSSSSTTIYFKYRDKNLRFNIDLRTPSLSNLRLNLDLRTPSLSSLCLNLDLRTPSLSSINIRNTPRGYNFFRLLRFTHSPSAL